MVTLRTVMNSKIHRATVTEAVRTAASGASISVTGLDGVALTRSQLAGNRCQHYVTFLTL